MKVVKIKIKTPEEMAEDIHAASRGASGPELADLVSKIMKENGYAPQDPVVRNQIGASFRRLVVA